MNPNKRIKLCRVCLPVDAGEISQLRNILLRGEVGDDSTECLPVLNGDDGSWNGPWGANILPSRVSLDPHLQESLVTQLPNTYENRRPPLTINPLLQNTLDNNSPILTNGSVGPQWQNTVLNNRPLSMACPPLTFNFQCPSTPQQTNCPSQCPCAPVQCPATIQQPIVGNNNNVAPVLLPGNQNNGNTLLPGNQKNGNTSNSLSWLGDLPVDRNVGSSSSSRNPIEIGPPPPPPPPPPTPLNQYTPDLRQGLDWQGKEVGGAGAIRELTAISQSQPGITDQSLTGNNLTTRAQWDAARWDGVPMSPCGMNLTDPTQLQRFCQFLFPSMNTMRGLEEVYNRIKPFADEKNPTPAEIENWNLEVVRHLRRLTGVTVPIENDKCLYLQAQWSNERQETTFWDAKYPAPPNPNDGPYYGYYGPCQGVRNPHCGFTFQPSCEEQAPYLNGQPCCPTTAKDEGKASVRKQIPWAMKLADVMQTYICNGAANGPSDGEGISGHAGPLFGATKMGLSWDSRLSPGGSYHGFRAQWRGDPAQKVCP